MTLVVLVMLAGLMEPQLFSINVVPSASVIVRWSYLQSISNAVNCSSSISPFFTCTASDCSRLVWFREVNGPVPTSLNSRIVIFYNFSHHSPSLPQPSSLSGQRSDFQCPDPVIMSGMHENLTISGLMPQQRWSLPPS